ncbi:MAG: L-threonylcarbamoyladenylate synthase [Patescibacteria group bacterium]
MQRFSTYRKNFPLLIAHLRRAEVIAAPTETAYGLLADATCNRAVKKIFKLKRRTSQKSLALVVTDLTMAKKYGRFSKLALKLAKKYWPGPLTMIVPARGKLATGISKNGWVGMRISSYRWLRLLIKTFGKPLTATSANLAGKQNLYSAKKVVRQLARPGLKFIVDSGNLPRRPTSTVVKVDRQKIILLRAGPIKVKI